MQTLFIDRKGTKLSCNQQRLYIQKNEQDSKAVSVPLHHIKSLVISCDCALSSGMLRQLAKHQIALICLNNRDPLATFISSNQTNGNVERRIKQYQLLREKELRCRFSSILIKNKIRQHRLLLKALSIMRQDLKFMLNNARSELLLSQKNLNNDDLTINEIMGIEGYASKIFFNAYKQTFNHNLQFLKRTKRPPKDPVNTILSLSYSILHHEAQRACYAHGLDPALAILHQPSYNRASLACDLQEGLRAHIDNWTWQLFQQRILREDHFKITNEGCILTKIGRGFYYNLLPDELLKWRIILRKHAQLLTKLIDGVSLYE